MQPEFEVVAFSLKPGEVSDIVDSPSGVHLIERYAQNFRLDSFFSTRAKTFATGFSKILHCRIVFPVLPYADTFWFCSYLYLFEFLASMLLWLSLV